MSVEGSKTLKPREEAKLSFESTFGSTIFLLGVDRSVNILKSGNNIDRTRIFNDLRKYNAYKDYGKLVISGLKANEDRYLDFGDSNAVILTNAYEGYVNCLGERAGPDTQNLISNPATDPTVEETLDTMEDFESMTREDFPETWLFDRVVVRRNGKAVFDKKVPDAITSWDVSAFALSNTIGLGIAEPLKLTVMQGFFANLNLPYSIRVGEILKVEVLVFSYFSDQAAAFNVDVTLYSKFEDQASDNEDNSDDEEDEPRLPSMFGPKSSQESKFDFYNADKSSGTCQYTIDQTANVAGLQTKPTKVSAKSGSTVHFYIKATKAGDIKLKVRAEVTQKSLGIFDEVIKKMRVNYEGYREYKNEVKVADLRKKDRDSHNFELEFSQGLVNNSVLIDVSVIGDVIGPSLTVRKIEPSSYM
jgi:CD109 antigen